MASDPVQQIELVIRAASARVDRAMFLKDPEGYAAKAGVELDPGFLGVIHREMLAVEAKIAESALRNPYAEFLGVSIPVYTPNPEPQPAPTDPPKPFPRPGPGPDPAPFAGARPEVAAIPAAVAAAAAVVSAAAAVVSAVSITYMAFKWLTLSAREAANLQYRLDRLGDLGRMAGPAGPIAPHIEQLRKPPGEAV